MKPTTSLSRLNRGAFFLAKRTPVSTSGRTRGGEVLERLDEAHEHGVVHHLEHLHLALQAHLHLELFHVRLVDGL